MRSLFRSGDRDAVERIRGRLAMNHGRGDGETQTIGDIVERAILEGIPFPDLVAETYLHDRAASALAIDGQEWLGTLASVYHASALKVDFWRVARKRARPETRTFLRGLIQGIPLFGQRPSAAEDEGSPYAMIGLEKLRFFLPGLIELRDQLVYREESGADFATDFCAWVEEIADAGRDLWFQCD